MVDDGVMRSFKRSSGRRCCCDSDSDSERVFSILSARVPVRVPIRAGDNDVTRDNR